MIDKIYTDITKIIFERHPRIKGAYCALIARGVVQYLEREATAPAMPALLDKPQAEPTYTEAQIIAAARAWSKRVAADCGVDADDQWKIYGDDVIADIRAVIADLSAGEVSQGAAPTAPDHTHVAYAEDGVLHWVTGRKFQNCELYVRAAQPNIQEAGNA